MYARLSLCACACANENDGEKECYGEMNERNDIYISKLRKKEKKKTESICGTWCSFSGAAPHIGLCMGNTFLEKCFLSWVSN